MNEKQQLPIERNAQLQTWPGDELFAENIEALKIRNPELAQRLTNVEIPDSAELVIANDGSVTYRIRQADGRRPWMGCSSVPLLLARENVKRTDVGYANMAMDSIASGAEAKEILQKMAPCQALFVTESDLVRLALVLRLRDFTAEFLTGRLVIFLTDQPAQQIEEFLNEHLGYNMITKSTTWAWRSDRENHNFAQQLSLAMQRCTKTAIAKMNELLTAQRQYDQQNQASATDTLLHALENPTAMRIANCTQAYTPVDCCTSRDVLAGAALLGAEVDHLVLDQPDKVSNIAQLERLRRLHPSLILLVDMLRGDFAYPLPESSMCVSLWRQANKQTPYSEPCMGKNDVIFTAYQYQLNLLRNLGYPANRIMHLPLAANTELYYPLESKHISQTDDTADVLMITDRYRIDPMAYQIKLPFQQQLWHAVAEEIRKGADKYHSETVPKFLARAKRKSQIDLQEEELQARFLTLIQNCLGDTILRDTYAEALVQAGFDLKIRTLSEEPDQDDLDNPLGWFDSPVRHCVIGPAEHGEPLNRVLNNTKIVLFVSSIGLADTLMLEAVAAGALVMVKTNHRDRTPDGIGHYFELGKEIITFETASDLLRKVRYHLSHDTERNQMTQAAREKLLARHTCQIRTRQMFQRTREQLSKND